MKIIILKIIIMKFDQWINKSYCEIIFLYIFLRTCILKGFRLMRFIGIITGSKSKKYILESIKEKSTISNVIFINESNIENVRNIKFDAIILNKSFRKQELLKKIIIKSNYILLNEDIETNYFLVKDMKLKIITYGFNSKSTITASSISNDEALICLQRGITDANGNKIEPQEVSVKCSNKLNIYDLMLIECIKMIFQRTKKD